MSAPTSLAPIVALRGVGMTYPAGHGLFVALGGIDLDIAAGEVTLLVGPSGSGKTTLLSIIGCILRPTSGAVLLGGREVAGLDEGARGAVRLAEIGFVFQGYNLFPTLTARQNVELALELKGARPETRRAAALGLLERVALADKADAYPADLSGGQKQRVAIARALAGAPRILLADEPTAALDLHTGRRVLSLFRQMARLDGRAVIVVTHDSRMLDLADRIVTLDDGRIVSDVRAVAETAEPASLNAGLLRRPRSFEAGAEILAAS